MEADGRFSVVSAYFTIYAYAALRHKLDALGRTRFLYGDPASVESVDPMEEASKAYKISGDDSIQLKSVLRQKPLSKACARWIEESVEVRTIRRTNFLHGKLYHLVAPSGATTAVVGSSNLTHRGLGLSTGSNIELNLEVAGELERQALADWFDELWNDNELTSDAKQDVLQALARLGKDYSPEFVYYKTLFHIFQDRIAEFSERDSLLHDVHLYDTEIWKRLYEFQMDGARSAIKRLLRHNGCIVADSVGLGKTWLALAVIKFFELNNERVLVLCPKKLEDNWIRYTSWAGYGNNPFEEDRFGYSVIAHTDLSRYEGMAGQIDLAKFNWGAFGLVVIDESHNFRNEGSDRQDEDGAVVRRSRYNRLLEEVISSGRPTKVLLLSATPVNTSLRDLRSQIYLITEKRRDAFRESLGIGDIQTVLGVAQREFHAWETRRRTDPSTPKSELLSSLGADFLSLLDAVTIARSRSHIRRFYPEVEEQVGGFPSRTPPENLHPPSDSENELSYDDLHGRISKFKLAIYMPSKYLLDTSELDAEKAVHRFDQRDRERWLIGMIRTNLLKRLESSVQSFALTMHRILDKMIELDAAIENWKLTKCELELNISPERDEDDDEYVVGKTKSHRLSELDVEAWQHDLRADRQIFQEMCRLAGRVTVDRDAKFAELQRLLRKKIESPTLDKDGRLNRKALVFTTFADTAIYLYDNLRNWARDCLGVHVAFVSGGGNRTTVGKSDFTEILARFSPVAQQGNYEEEVDILIATDCLSEGQNLQDCDLVVNYDVHWNPVRLMQRFGRIDRLGSRNHRVWMTNFWPTEDLDRYLDLRNRVESRMALADAAGTGLDDLLNQQSEFEVSFRDEQLKRLRIEILDVEQAKGGVSLSDFTLDDFIAELLNYLQRNRVELERAPLGICAVTKSMEDSDSDDSFQIFPGVIFCFRQTGEFGLHTPNVLQPYFLVYILDDGFVKCTFRQARQCLDLFRSLTVGRDKAIRGLIDAFETETQHGNNMGAYENVLTSALTDVRRTFQKAELAHLGKGDREAKLGSARNKPGSNGNMELVTWLVIREEAIQ